MKKIIAYTSLILIIIVVGYGIAYKISPTPNSKLQTGAVDIGSNKNGDALIQVYFTFDLDKKPIFSKQHTVTIKWNEGWKLEAYNIKKNGYYSKSGRIVSPPNYSGYVELPINTKENIDKNGQGEGYVILASENKELLSGIVKSSASVKFIYQSLVKDFQIADSIGWNNEQALN
jgi:hypothetical protein